MLYLGRGLYAQWADEDLWSALRWTEAALERFKQRGVPLDIAHAQMSIALNLLFLGAHARAERAVREAPECPGEELWIMAANRGLYLSAILIRQGALEEARRVAEALVESGRARHGALLEGFGRSMLAEIYLRQGDLVAAEREAVIARGQLATMPNMRTPLIMSLALIRLMQGRVAEALADAEEAMAGYKALRMFVCRGSFARLVYAEVLKAAGHHERALAAIAEARASLLVNAAKIGDPELRRSFLEDIPENARTFELARQWLGEA
jgi:tetratricopeptide (TPR) repeat protein